jgi:hypothetical protein
MYCYKANRSTDTKLHIKVKQSRYTPLRRLGKRMYSSYSFTTSAIDGVSGQGHAPAALYPWRKDPRYPLDRKLGGPQSRSGHRGLRKNPLPLQGIEPRSPCRPDRSQTLYYLSYPAPQTTYTLSNKITQHYTALHL